ncbi:LOW QUALITY PROTEIN: killer cell lectin-like receptor subfamily F member 2 [Ailuropoda melanoleuca]|uniref:LOW QUALITY PROTEIN: killer cell lectin-like receptor subfamily F member 2 n=1 Tax=Ailuropoda melanoleuca TaxID=9646 RepID=UPI00149443C3|nr:LOW QUALITY PROTEIN: killer cell lectin-like receptor subfamily F member 2 [Ailuropoda melanoleuca]
MENEDGYMVLDCKNLFKSRQRSKDFSLYPRYYRLMLVCSCVGILIFMITLISLNFWDLFISERESLCSSQGEEQREREKESQADCRLSGSLMSFLLMGPMDHKSCAVITGNQVYSEDCNSRFNGICQRDAV